jgi:urease accessory protein
MNETAARRMLSMLQHADSAFPSGGFAFSSGIEGLANLGTDLGARGLTDVVSMILCHRWATSDRIALALAYRAAADLDRLAQIDADIEATTLVESFRTGSRRNGGALLAAHVRIATPGAAELRAAIRSERLLGHLPVVQGMLWRALGLQEDEAIAVSAHQTAAGLVTAAIRLGCIGAIEAQIALGHALDAAAAVSAVPVEPGAELHSFVPLVEIAAMTHARADLRLFAN